MQSLHYKKANWINIASQEMYPAEGEEDRHPNSSLGIMRYLRDHPPSHYSFKVKPFSLLVKSKVEKHESSVFEAGGYKWKLILYPNGNQKADGKDHISLYLAIADATSLPHGWEVNVDFKLFVFDRSQNKHLTVQDANEPIKKFHEKKTQWGFAKLLPLGTLNDEKQGFLIDDCCVFGAEVLVIQPTEREGHLYIEEPDTGTFSSKLEEHSHDSDMLTGGERNRQVTVYRELHNKPQDSSLFVFPRLSCHKDVPPEREEYRKYELPTLEDSKRISRTRRYLPPAHCLFEIESFSSLSKQESQIYESGYFEVDGYQWRFSLHLNRCQKGNGNGQISPYLRIMGTEYLPSNWDVNVNFKLFVFDQRRDEYLTIQDADGIVRRFHKGKTNWGFDQLLSLDDVNCASNGFLVNDSCIFGAEIFVIRPNCIKEFPPLKKNNTNYNTFTWKIDKFSGLHGEFYESEGFNMGGIQWVLKLGYGTPKEKWISLYMSISNDARSIPLTQEWDTKYKFRIRDQVNGNHFYRTCDHCFKHPFLEDWGYPELISLTELNDASKGYVKNDVIVIQLMFTYLVKRDIVLETWS